MRILARIMFNKHANTVLRSLGRSADAHIPCIRWRMRRRAQDLYLGFVRSELFRARTHTKECGLGEVELRIPAYL